MRVRATWHSVSTLQTLVFGDVVAMVEVACGGGVVVVVVDIARGDSGGSGGATAAAVRASHVILV